MITTEIDRIIEMAWEDKTPFEAIKIQFGITEADVIKLYFGLGEVNPLTLEEIGEKFDLSRERVRQIKEKTIKLLKQVSRSKILKTYLGK